MLRSSVNSRAATSRCGRRRCGGCSTRPPPAPARSSPSTSSSSTSSNRRAPICSKRDEIEWVHWGTGTAHLLPRLLRLPDGQGRSSGPLFLASRKPVPARRPPARDICPHTGRARLGYDRARILLKDLTGWQLHQLRHSAATHLGHQKVPLQLIMASWPRPATNHRAPRCATCTPAPQPSRRSPSSSIHPDERTDAPELHVRPGQQRPRSHEHLCIPEAAAGRAAARALLLVFHRSAMSSRSTWLRHAPASVRRIERAAIWLDGCLGRAATG